MHLQLPYFNLLLAFIQLSHARPPIYHEPPVDMRSLHGLSSLSVDRSGKRGDPPGKYFHEATFHPHYDGRFAPRILPYESRIHHLTALVRTYLSTMHSIGAETWIMHGSLLGWYWNRKIMPWDSDIDVQVSQRSIEFLANYYNMTVHHFKVPKEPEEGDNGVVKEEGRNYMLEINPYYANGSVTDRLNVIDGRWIDISTGLFIDITTLRRNETAEALGIEGVMMCKDRHHYLEKDIFPLRESVFEGMPVKVPYAYTELLEEEYGADCLTKTVFEGHKFDQEKMEWVRMQPIIGQKTGPLRAMRPGRFRHSTDGPADDASEKTQPKSGSGTSIGFT